MTTFGEFPAEADRTLTCEEIAQFRNNVLWPSVQWLKRGVDYMREAPVGSRFEIGETVLMGDIKITVWFQAQILPEYIDEDDLCGRVAQVRASTEFSDPTMAQDLIETARASGVVIDPLEEEQNLLSAWIETDYLIDDTDDPFRVETTHKLKGFDDEELWSDESMGITESSLSDDEAESLEILQGFFEGEMTLDHQEYIRFVLSILGVPEEIVFPELD